MAEFYRNALVSQTVYVTDDNDQIIAPDATPDFAVLKNGAASGVVVSVVVAGLAYDLTFQIPSDWDDGTRMDWQIDAVVGGAPLQKIGLIGYVTAEPVPGPATGTAAEMYEAYRDAEIAILAGQSVSWGDRSLTMADLAEIKSGRSYWEKRKDAEALQASGKRRSFGAQAVWQ